MNKQNLSDQLCSGGSTAIGKEYFKNVPETKLYFYIACLRDIEMLLYSRSINILLDKGT